MGIKLIKSGLLTTIQDCGRFGYQKEGMVVSGAMDKIALRLANILVGNNEGEACMEITQAGPAVLFEKSCLIALTGANLSPTIHTQPVPLWRPVYVCQGSLLEFGTPLDGYRAYIAFAGGLAIPKVLGSYSTYLRARIGGWQGRALQTGDQIAYKTPGKQPIAPKLLNSKPTFAAARWTLSPRLLPSYKPAPVIRVIKGPEYDLFTEESKHNLWHSAYQISHQSDRMGYRLQGSMLSCLTVAEMLSSAVTFGTIQVPPNGQPIILMADHQTTGGYPRVGQIATVDLPLLAQASPGHSITFQNVPLREAQHLYILEEKKIQLIREILRVKTTGSLLI